MDVLGKGAHGRIYLATDLVTHDRVAIKLVSQNLNAINSLNIQICKLMISNCFFLSIDGKIK